MNQTSETSRKESLKPCFTDHGIREGYLDAWFSNYEITCEAQQKVFDAVVAASKTNRPMVFLGTFGGGKTHLATAMVKSALYHGKEALYYTLTSLCREYRVSLNSEDTDEGKFFDKVAKADLLVIDEYSIKSNSDSENRVIQEIVDFRYADKRQTVFIANMSEEAFVEDIGQRLLERLQERNAEILIFNWESYRKGKK